MDVNRTAAVEEALRRDPSLRADMSPETLTRLNASVEAIQSEWALQSMVAEATAPSSIVRTIPADFVYSPARPSNDAKTDLEKLEQSAAQLDKSTIEAASKVQSLGAGVAAFGIIVAIFGVLGALILCFVQVDDPSGYGKTNPYVTTGITLGFLSIVQAIFITLIGRYAEMRGSATLRDVGRDQLLDAKSERVD